MQVGNSHCPIKTRMLPRTQVEDGFLKVTPFNLCLLHIIQHCSSSFLWYTGVSTILFLQEGAELSHIQGYGSTHTHEVCCSKEQEVTSSLYSLKWWGNKQCRKSAWRQQVSGHLWKSTYSHHANVALCPSKRWGDKKYVSSHWYQQHELCPASSYLRGGSCKVIHSAKSNTVACPSENS